MKHFLMILILFFSSYFNTFAENNNQFDINGVIRDAKGQIVAHAKVKLRLIEMASPPKLASTSETKTDSQGAYVFKNRQAVSGFFYRVSAEKDGRDTISSPFRTPKEGNTKTINLRLPNISTDKKDIVFEKEILVFNLANEGLRVTNVYNLLNNSNAIVNVKDFPYKVQLPGQAKNTVVLKLPEGSEHDIESDFINFHLYLKPGPHQILLSYHLPSDSSYLTINHAVLPEVSEIEVITPAIGISAELFPKGKDQITEQKKTFEKESYISKTIQFEAGRKKLQIKVSGFPTPPYQMMIPAFIIICLLFLGLVIYVIRNAKKLNPKIVK